MEDLKEKAFLGVIWGSGSLVFKEIISLIVKLILIRLLIPDEFGLAAMAAIVMSSLDIIISFGIGGAFVRDYKSDQEKAKNTLFYLNGVAHILIALTGFLIAPYIAGFFSNKLSDPQTIFTLIWIIRVLSLTHLLNLITVVPSAVLNKELRFKEGVIATLVGLIIYGIVAVILAFLGFGVWALILSQVASRIMYSIATFFYVPFIPSLSFDKEIAKRYFTFGINSFISAIFNIIIENGDDTIIGRLLGAAALGFYSISQHFSGILVSVVSGVVNSIIFPVFSKIQDNKELYARAFFKTFRLTNLLTIPAIGGAVVLAREIVLLVFGERWLPLLPAFYVLSITAFLSNLVSLAGPVLNSLNKPHILRNNRLIQFCFFVVLIYPFTKFFGLVGTSLVMVVFSLVSIVHYAPILAKEVSGFYKNMFEVLAKILPITLVMMVIVYFIKQFVPVNFFWLFALVFIGIIVYFAPMWLIDKDLKWDVKEGWSILREKLPFFK